RLGAPAAAGGRGEGRGVRRARRARPGRPGRRGRRGRDRRGVGVGTGPGMRILVTNDDGLHAPGLLALATALDAAGHEVLAVAPHGDRSGSGAAIGNLVDGSYVRYREMPLAGLDRVHSIELDGPPALCVF